MLAIFLSTALAANALVPLTSQEGLTRLSRSQARVDFAHLANEFEAQENKAFCGIASAVIVLNALRDRVAGRTEPEDKRLLPEGWPPSSPFDPLFPRYTQGDVFTPATDAVKSRAQILGAPRVPGGPHDGGLQLRQLGEFLEALGLDASAHVAGGAVDLGRMRADLTQNLSTEGDYAIVNYDRSGLGQTGGGHISPLGAYDQQTDSFLILDVNPNHAPWDWASAADLYRAMSTRDAKENRGYLLVRERN